jgi:hypothetical protein
MSELTSKELLPFPSSPRDPLVSADGKDNFYAYHAACHSAALQRLRIAVKALKSIRTDSAEIGYDAGCAGIHAAALDALVAIGRLPE